MQNLRKCGGALEESFRAARLRYSTNPGNNVNRRLFTVDDWDDLVQVMKTSENSDAEIAQILMWPVLAFL